jgi:AcrR family transcriptional regulator
MYYSDTMRLGQRTKVEAGDTAGRILEHARRAFNERGVMAVGIREIARDLDLSPGNVSYHFPTKEALVTALVELGHRRNNAAVATPDHIDFTQLDTILRDIMRRDLENAWLLRDYVGLMLAFPPLREIHVRLQRARESRVDAVVTRLITARLLDRRRAERALPQLRLQLLTQIMFWLPAALCAAPDRDPAVRLDAHVKAALALFLPHCTIAGRRGLALHL